MYMFRNVHTCILCAHLLYGVCAMLLSDFKILSHAYIPTIIIICVCMYALMCVHYKYSHASHGDQTLSQSQ